MSYDQSIVISHAAALTPIGAGYAELKSGLRRSEHRLGPATIAATDANLSKLLSGELRDFDPTSLLGVKGLRHKDRNALILLACMQLDFANLLPTLDDPNDIGLAVGTTFGSLFHQIDFSRIYLTEGFRGLNAMQFPNMVINVPPSQGNIWFNLTHSSTTISNGFTAGLDAVIFAADAIRVGRAQRIIAGGSEDFLLEMAVAFDRQGWGSKSSPIRPFDSRRSGTLLGEGAGLVLLESAAAAAQRKARPMAKIVGYGSSFDGAIDWGFNPAAEGATRAIKLALESAQLTPNDIDFIAASANGSVEGDAMEAKAIHAALGPSAQNIPVVAYKSYWGECCAASGAMQLVAALADLEDNTVSVTCGTEKSDLNLAVTKEPLKKKRLRTALINSFGYTGQNSAMIVQKVE